MRELRFVKAITRLENADALDPIVDRVRGIVDALAQPRALRDLLHGVPFGHPLHPLAVQVPLGMWVSAAALDALPGSKHASTVLTGLGIATATPAIASGYMDWSQLHEQQMRVGIVHSSLNGVALTFYAASLVQRLRGKHTSGTALGLVGLAVVSASGFLGGHLSYRQAAGANHTEDVPHRFPQGWQVVGPLADLPDGALTRRDVAGLPLLAYRRGASVDVLSNVCSHLSAPLDEGTVQDADGTDPCVECPWHDSVFSLRSGEVVHGPATSPQPRFDTRIRDGVLEVYLEGAG